MNAADRKQLSAHLSKLEGLRSEVETIAEGVRSMADAEQEKFNNMSEGLQQGERGQAIEEAANNLSTIADALESGNLDDAISEFGNIELN